VRYAFIERYRTVWPIARQCQVLKVRASGYRQYRARQTGGTGPLRPGRRHVKAIFNEMKGALASHVPGVSFRRVAFRLAKGPSSTFARALCDDGERVRDKIAASKHKGLWVGGPVPLGCRTEAVCRGAGLKSDMNKGL
jgi:hypothetical protein